MKTIVCIGDSITAGNNGYDSDPSKYVGTDSITYPYEYNLFVKLTKYAPTVSYELASNGDYITKYMGFDLMIINSGKGGTSTKYWRDNFQALALNYNPDFIVLIGCANDVSEYAVGGSQTIEQSRDNYTYMINQCLQKGIKPVLCRNTPKSASYTASYPSYVSQYEAFDSWLSQYCISNNFYYVDTVPILADANGYTIIEYDDDGVHLSALGYQTFGYSFDVNIFNNSKIYKSKEIFVMENGVLKRTNATFYISNGVLINLKGIIV